MEMRKHRGLPTVKSDLSTMKWKFLFFLFFFFTFVIISATCYGLNCVLPEFTSSPNPQCDGHRAFRAVTQVKGGHKAGLVMFDRTGLCLENRKRLQSPSCSAPTEKRPGEDTARRQLSASQSLTGKPMFPPLDRDFRPPQLREKRISVADPPRCVLLGRPRQSSTLRVVPASLPLRGAAHGPFYRASPDTSCASGIVSVARDAAEN
uniref:Uncharacterized protein n=1 Tax=Rousettus aegyptiacus TaxID=9407 RepID=A0A7J8B9T0_ROUAE|nr:hypothetical protein HJG63_010006 [Rousettus aegyptiacus]